MMKRSYYQKVAFLGILLLILFIFQEYTSKEKENFPNVKFVSEKEIPLLLTDFNPNDFDEKQWQSLGFSAKQTLTILNYKKMIGGAFTSKQQLKKCYAISEEKYTEISPYILLPENKDLQPIPFKNSEKKTIAVFGKFNPNHLSAKGWTDMGFTEKQSQSILKYKSYLGGSFVSKQKFKDCFIISDENYHRLEPYLILPEKTPENYKNSQHDTSPKPLAKIRSFDPNTLGIKGWQSLGFSQNQAQTIINYRDKNLKGQFKNADDIKKCFVISSEKFEELRPYIKINTLSTSENKSESILQQKTDFALIDLNLITFKQLLEFGLDEKSAGSIIGFRKKLGGFMNKQQILETYNIDIDLVQKLTSICKLDSSNITKYTLVDAPEEWLKNHPYFKYSADKIIFYRISNPDDKKIWKFLKLKPEYEARMKLYLK